MKRAQRRHLGACYSGAMFVPIVGTIRSSQFTTKPQCQMRDALTSRLRVLDVAGSTMWLTSLRDLIP